MLVKAIQELKAKNYLSVWFVNGGRRLRVLVPALRGGSPHTSGGKSQDCTDNENNKKKTTQPKKCVFSFPNGTYFVKPCDFMFFCNVFGPVRFDKYEESNTQKV